MLPRLYGPTMTGRIAAKRAGSLLFGVTWKILPVFSE